MSELLNCKMKEYADICEAAMQKSLTSNEPFAALYQKLISAAEYSVFAGGKRIRPYLVLEFYRMISQNADVAPAVAYAAAIEMIHTSSLIHDDLPAMDNDSMRRGKPTNHIIYGEATAILAGDALITSAFETAADNKLLPASLNAQAVSVLARRAGINGMMAGQQIDLQSEKTGVSAQTLEIMHKLKTGCLISCACELGCVAAGSDEKTQKKAYEFGQAVGLTFQVTDDILDVEGSAEIMGKSVGKDENSVKSTFPALYGLEKSKIIAGELCQLAKSILGDFPDCESKNNLRDLCDYIVGRKK